MVWMGQWMSFVDIFQRTELIFTNKEEEILYFQTLVTILDSCFHFLHPDHKIEKLIVKFLAALSTRIKQEK